MKNVLSAIIISAAMFFIAGCEQFTTSYQRVDESEFRLLDFIYEPADAAPGDSVTLTAVFAGKEVELDGYIEWWISFNMIRDLYGTETVVDSVRLEPISERIYREFSPNTQTVAFRFKIPDDIVRKSAAIPDRWTDMLPSYMVNMLNSMSPELASMTKKEVIDAIESGHPAVINPLMMQFFTVPIRVTAKIKEPGRLPHTIRSSHSIRYNSRFPEAVPINNNPGVDGIMIFGVKGENPLEPANVERFYYLGHDIPIEDGYTYYFEADLYGYDRTITMDGNSPTEDFRVFWQFQLDSEETAGVHHSRYMTVNSISGRITLPTDKRITKFTVWATVVDEVINERMRPQGSMLAERTGRFVYRN